MSSMSDDDLRKLQLIRFDRWCQRRYAAQGWQRARVWAEDIGLGIAIGLLAVLVAR